MSHENAIAIIGMSCRLPGARDVEEFWRNLRAGADGISRFSQDELLAAGVDPALAGHPDYVPARGVIAGGDRFDWEHFGYSAAEAEGIDPQQRVFLECAAQALDDAGTDPARTDGWIGVYAGCDTAAAPLASGADPARATMRIIGYEKDFLATRVAYKLGLRGPAVTVQTACSTSLVAVHQACRALLGYECDTALAGGVTVRLPEAGGYLYQDGNILSKDGRCRAFDAAASGTVSSSGVGVVVLKRLDDALEHGDRVIAVIHGSAINNDGGEKIGFTAPSVTGQRDVIELALAQAGVGADEIGYVEAHGTGTRVGDPVELAALTAAYRAGTDRVGYCLLGAAKANIGHTGAASGVAGLIKTALMLQHREFVPTPHFKRPNPELKLDTTPFRISTELRPWAGGGARLAGVSSFGIGGTNAHVVLGEAPPTGPEEAGQHEGRQDAEPVVEPAVLCLSASSPETLHTLREQLADRLGAPNAPALADTARTLAARRRFRHRVTVAAGAPGEAAQRLREAERVTLAGREPETAFLFPGQGALRAGYGLGAHTLLPVFRDVFEDCREQVRRRFGVEIAAMLDPATPPAWFADTRHQQLGLFILGYGLARQLESWEVHPAALFGHSIGEYTAAAVAGVWNLPDALGLVWQRAQAMHDAAPGRMLALRIGADQAAALLDADVSLAVAGGDHVVLSGPVSRITELAGAQRELGVQGRLLETEHAFHSPLMASSAYALRRAVAATAHQAPRVPFASNLTGDWADPAAVGDPEYWAGQLLGTVRLEDGLRTLTGSGAKVLIELGPGDGLTRQTLGGSLGTQVPAAAVPLLGRDPGQESAAVLRGLGRLWEHGVEVPWDELRPDGRSRLVSLPPHPMAGTRCRPAPRQDQPASAGQQLTGGQSAGERPIEDRPVAEQAVETRSVQPADRPAQPLAPRGGQPEPAGTGRAGSFDVLAERVAALWRASLGVGTALPGDDFYELGGSSLMIVGLLAQVRTETGAQIPAAAVATSLTFRQLVAMVREKAPEAGTPTAARATGTTGTSSAGRTAVPDVPGLTLLRDGGPRNPLFLLAPAGGSTLSYRHLAAAMDDSRPVYGIESPGMHDRRRTLYRLEQIAAHQVGVLRRARPNGPYLLGGWSFGAMVAHEMTRQLTAEGAQVRLLLAIDGYLPDTGGRPVATRPRWLKQALSFQVEALVKRGRSKLIGAGPGRDGDAAQGGLNRIGDLAGATAAGVPDFVRVHNANLTAMLRHRPQPAPCGLVLFKAAADRTLCAELARRLAPLYQGEVRVEPVPGDHWSALGPEHAATLAGRLRPYLEPLD
ncbi:beta-ketoacyl synthase N-terminal-like domain-containing protein [Kitasatospora sp. GP82]|uniref:type I polyketide synthase n=1 Tax=Kitasatospora sp. GP82 TaxID=3035089 RepID=UPI0024762E3F|nr:beta-ketoacyl synthase N-terminal-like domain-containing protein [Kitasatospora sp. GP82]MDH6128538.1 phthiocerol/phenolphthiocerol synthesis type-I polyketide synthase E [Kitasatospora sp. GP82]